MTIRQMYYCTRGKTRCNDRVQVTGDFDCGRTDACLLVENDLMKSERFAAKVLYSGMLKILRLLVLWQDACEIREILRQDTWLQE